MGFLAHVIHVHEWKCLFCDMAFTYDEEKAIHMLHRKVNKNILYIVILSIKIVQ